MKIAAALVLSLIASPALAEAVTYQGTIGDQPVFVEFSEPPHAGNASIFGRYFYIEQGVDIPLHAAPAARSRIGLVEELPCTVEKNNCPNAQEMDPTDPPLGARWHLDVAEDASTLTGEFRLNGRDLPVALEQIGTREFDPSEGLLGFSSFAASLFYADAELSLETSPYDYVKMALFDFDNGDAVVAQGGRYYYATDMRTKFPFPRIIELDGGTDYRPANAALEQRHWTMGLDALSCLAQQYQGFGWNGYSSDQGTLGWWDEEQVEVHYLSPTVMTWTESGSLSCGSAHPYNHHEFHNLDVTTGEPLDLSRIFKGWVATTYAGELVDLDVARESPGDYHWGPDADLLAFVNEHRLTNEELGFPGEEGEDGCPIDELIAEYLAIGFKGDDVVLFSMDGLPHVAVACGSDLFEAPIAELTELLTPEAADYFPSLPKS